MADFDLQMFLPYLLNQAAEASGQEFQRLYKGRYGMLRTEWRVLFHLGIYGRMTAGEICARASMHKTKISRAVARLEERRLLKRERDKDDRRVDWLTLTAAGQVAYGELREAAAEYDARMAASLAPEDVAALRRMLRQLAASGDRGPR